MKKRLTFNGAVTGYQVALEKCFSLMEKFELNP